MKNQTIAIIAASTLLFTACAPAAQPESATPPSSASNGDQQVPLIPAPEPGVTDTPAPVNPFPEDAKKFSSPWTRKDTMIVIDAYSGNAIDWNKMATDPRVTAVLHRSSIGLTVDSLYKSREKIARQRGYLWGAYHLGKSGDPIAQAKLFLSTIGDPTKVLMALDLEDTSAAGMMTIPNAKIFLNYVFAQTGKMPVVYANQSVTQHLNSAAKGDPTFAMSRLWYARFRTDVPDFPHGIFATYFLWQFSSEINCTATGKCLYNVPGTSFDMDINVFYGSKAALEFAWSL